MLVLVIRSKTNKLNSSYSEYAKCVFSRRSQFPFIGMGAFVRILGVGISWNCGGLVNRDILFHPKAAALLQKKANIP